MPTVSATYLELDGRDEAAIAADVSLLDRAERARREAFAFASDRDEFTAAHALLRRTLSRRCDVDPREWTFEAGPFGKPFAPSAQTGARPIAFNLSHTRGLVACGVGEAADLGIDVEPVDRPRTDVEKLADRCFSPLELEQLRACRDPDRRVRFTELWVLKEAYIKAIGAGLAQPLRSFWFDFADDDVLTFTPPAGESREAWRFALFAIGRRYRMAIAVRSHDPIRLPEIAAGPDAQRSTQPVLLRSIRR